MTKSVEKTIQPAKIIESAKNELESIKGVCRVISLDLIDIQRIHKLEKLDEQTGSKAFGKKYNFGIQKVLFSDVVLSFMVNKEYDWPVNTIKLFRGEKMIGEDTQDQSVIKKLSECNDSLIIGNIIFYDKETLKNNDRNGPIYMIVTEQPCPQLDPLWSVYDAIMGIPSSYTHEYLLRKICGDQKQMLGSFLVGFNIHQRVTTIHSINDLQLSTNIKNRKCQPPL